MVLNNMKLYFMQLLTMVKAIFVLTLDAMMGEQLSYYQTVKSILLSFRKKPANS